MNQTNEAGLRVEARSAATQFEGLSVAQTDALLKIGNGDYQSIRSGPHLAKLAELSLIAQTGPHGRYELTETAKYWILGQCAKWNAKALQEAGQS